MASKGSGSRKGHRNSILKVRQTTTDIVVKKDEVIIDEATAKAAADFKKKHRRVSFHHEKTVKQFDKEKLNMSASPFKEPCREGLSDCDSTKGSVGADDTTLSLFRGMLNKPEIASAQQAVGEQANELEKTMDLFARQPASIHSIHTRTIDVEIDIEDSVAMEMSHNATANDTLQLFSRPALLASSQMVTPRHMTVDMDITVQPDDPDATINLFKQRPRIATPGNRMIADTADMEMSVVEVVDSPASSEATMACFTFGKENRKSRRSILDTSVPMDITAVIEEKEEEHGGGEADETMALFKMPRTTGDDVHSQPMDITVALGSQSRREGEEEQPHHVLDDTMALFGPVASSQEKGATTNLNVSSDAHSQPIDMSVVMNTTQKKEETLVERLSATMTETRNANALATPKMTPHQPSPILNEQESMMISMAQVTPSKPALTTLRDDALVAEPAAPFIDLAGSGDSSVMEVSAPEVQKEESDESLRPTTNVCTRKRLSTLVEVSSRLTAASSQGLVERVDGEDFLPTSQELGDSNGGSHEEPERKVVEEDGEAMEEEEKSLLSMDVSSRMMIDHSSSIAGEKARAAGISRLSMAIDGDHDLNATFEIAPAVGHSKMEASPQLNATYEIAPEDATEVRNATFEVAPEASFVANVTKTEKTMSAEVEEEEEGSAPATPSSCMELDANPSPSPMNTTTDVVSTARSMDSSALAQTMTAEEEELKEEEEAPVAASPTSAMERDANPMSPPMATASDAVSTARSIDRSQLLMNSSGFNARRSLSGSSRRSGRSLSSEEASELSLRSAREATFYVNKNQATRDLGCIPYLDAVDSAFIPTADDEDEDRILAAVRTARESLSSQLQEAIKEDQPFVTKGIEALEATGYAALAAAVRTLNPSKLTDINTIELVHWARREAQREWWEMRAQAAAGLQTELQAYAVELKEANARAQDDIVTAHMKNDLEAEVAALQREDALLNGLSATDVKEVVDTNAALKKRLEEKTVALMELRRYNMVAGVEAFGRSQQRIGSLASQIAERLQKREANRVALRAYLCNMKEAGENPTS